MNIVIHLSLELLQQFCLKGSENERKYSYDNDLYVYQYTFHRSTS